MNFDKTALKVCYKVLLSKNFQRQSCSAINCLSNGVNILAGDDPVPVKFAPKDTDLQYEGCAFHVSHAARCTVSDSRLSCNCRSRIKGVFEVIGSHASDVGALKDTFVGTQ